jgi:DMSO/TMAO reductase YedYZ molybdopterin-dependent catalytic subunit
VTIDKSSASAVVRGAVAGILAGGLALGVAQLIAGLISSTSSPVIAVGGLSIDFTPPAVKNFAIRAFGSHDKVVLVSGILVVLAVFAAAIGVLAMRRLAYGMAGLGLFVLVGLIAALTRPGASASDVAPTLIGGIAAALALRRLARLATPAPGAAASPTPVRPGTAQPALPEYIARQSNEQPTTGQPTTGQPTTGQPTTGQPTTGQPTTGQPTTGQPTEPEPRPGSAPPSVPAEWRPAQPATGPGSYRSPPPASGRPGGALRPPSGPQRRSFITTGAAVAGVAVVGGLGGKLLAERGNVTAARKTLRIPPPSTPAPPLPAGVDLKIPGLSSFITPNSTFYRVDTAIVLPEITPATWQLRIHGMVAKEITLSFDELIRRPLFEDYITLTCVSNPVAGPYIGNAKWLGASLSSLLREAGVRSGAEQLLATSSDGFTSGSPVQVAMDGRDSMLAVAMNGSALPVEHGFPVRMVIPGLYGYVSACKWVTDIEVTTYAANRAYWADRGWDQQAPIKTESRIDVPTSGGALKAGPHPVAGVAWAQHKGIDAVEVRVDKGSWNTARLAAVPGIDTWRQWVWDWDATPGTHLIESRATDRTGFTQTALQAPPEPNGASGYPQTVVKVSA